jgi:pyruvate/2-oxoacid:ferredoxin oxidoreductase beta subunit
MARCWSCGTRKVDPEADYCYGCKHVVCYDCITRYGHIAGGQHGKTSIITCPHCGKRITERQAKDGG